MTPPCIRANICPALLCWHYDLSVFRCVKCALTSKPRLQCRPLLSHVSCSILSLQASCAHPFKRLSSFRTSCLDLKRRCRNLTRIRVYRDIHSQTRKGTSDNAAREVEILLPHVSEMSISPCESRCEFSPTYRLCSTQRLFRSFHSGLPIDAHATDGLEALVRQHKDAAVVSLEVVDLLAEQ